METVQNVASVINILGTLIMAWLVYQLGRQQAESTQAMAERQLALAKQNLRFSLLHQRIEILSEIRALWFDFSVVHRGAQLDYAKMVPALLTARLIFDDEVVSDLDEINHRLFSLESFFLNRVTPPGAKPVRTIPDGDPDAELDRIWEVLKPVLKRMEQATRITESTI